VGNFISRPLRPRRIYSDFLARHDNQERDLDATAVDHRTDVRRASPCLVQRRWRGRRRRHRTSGTSVVASGGGQLCPSAEQDPHGNPSGQLGRAPIPLLSSRAAAHELATSDPNGSEASWRLDGSEMSHLLRGELRLGAGVPAACSMARHARARGDRRVTWSRRAGSGSARVELR